MKLLRSTLGKVEAVRDPVSERAAVHAVASPPPCDLKRMFEDLACEPMPQKLVDLCDKLEDAFRKGELYTGKTSRSA